MIRLFRSSLYRALKSKIFFACLIVNAAVALIGCLYQAYSLRPSGYEVSALGIFYSGFGGGMSLIGILSALTVSIFVGTEFTSGAMRNKVIVGSGRVKLYWCNLVTACALCVLIYAGYHLVNFTLGTAILGWGGGASGRFFCRRFDDVCVCLDLHRGRHDLPQFYDGHHRRHRGDARRAVHGTDDLRRACGTLCARPERSRRGDLRTLSMARVFTVRGEIRRAAVPFGAGGLVAVGRSGPVAVDAAVRSVDRSFLFARRLDVRQNGSEMIRTDIK